MSVTAFIRHAATRCPGKVGLSMACLFLGAAAFGVEPPTAYAGQKDPGYYGTPLRFAPPPVDVSRGTVDMEQENIRRSRTEEYAPTRERSSSPSVRNNENPVRQTIVVPEAATPPVVSVPTPSPTGKPAPTDQTIGGGQDNRPDAVGTPAMKKPVPAIRLFGTVDFRGILKDLPKWERVLQAERHSPSFSSSGLACKSPSVQKRWLALKGRLEGASIMEKAKGVNRFFNQWPYKTDLMVWGVEDYWATPCEFVLKSGDCEDYAIAKYFALKELGVPVKTMRIAAVNDTIRGAGHAVLVLFLEKDAYVLDNLTNMVLSHEKLKHYRPVYTVNEEYLWRHVKPVAGPKQ